MLNLFRRHGARCKSHGKRSQVDPRNKDCPAKPKHCPIYLEGVDGQGRVYKPQRLLDPLSGETVLDGARAWKIVEAMMLPPAEAPKPRVTILEAIEAYLRTKAFASADYRRKSARILSEMRSYLETEPRFRRFLDEVVPTDLSNWVSTWEGKASTRTRKRETVRQFFGWGVRADLSTKDPSGVIAPFREEHVQRDPFTEDELRRIFEYLPNITDEYGRTGTTGPRRIAVFVMLQYYLGTDVATTMKIRKSEVDWAAGKIYTYRKKTDGELGGIPVPQPVLTQLQEIPAESDEYFFWSGTSSPVNRANDWYRKIRRKVLTPLGLKHRSPHNFRHSFAVRHLRAGVPLHIVSRLLGHKSTKITEKFYFKWSKDFQSQLDSAVKQTWTQDAVSQADVLQTLAVPVSGQSSVQ